jgi:thiol-disulfide isomerase/thioredoxin
MKKLFVFLLLLGNLAYSQQELSNVILKNLNSENVTITELNEPGKLYVYAFWATWCAPCIQELDAISDVYEDWKKELSL